MTKLSPWMTASALLLMGTVSSVALAETPAAPPAQNQAAPPASMMNLPSTGAAIMGNASGARAGGPMGDPKAMADERLETLKKELNITGAQTAAWNTYADAVRKRADTMVKNRTTIVTAMHANGTPMSRLDAQISMTESVLANMKQTRGALDALYNTLSAEQRAKADTMIGKGPL